MGIRRLVSAVLVPVLFVGCVGADEEVTATSASSRAGAPVSVSSQPLLRIGKAEGSEADILNRVVTPFLMPDGRVVVPVAGDQAIRIYSAEGALEQTLGSRGEGPGEFVSIVSAWAVGDTLEIWDDGLQRLTRFVNGTLSEVLRINASGGAVPGRLGSAWVFTGLTNAAPSSTTRPPGTVKQDTVGFYLTWPDGSPPRELARVPGLTRYVTSRQRTQPAPLSPQARVGLLDGLLLVGHTLDVELQGFDSLGIRQLELLLDLPPMSDPDETQRAVLDAWEARGRSLVGSLDFSDAPVPQRVSRYWDFLVDSENLIWVLLYDPLRHAHALGGWRGPGPGGTWVVFDRSGTLLAEVELPDRFYPSQILEDRIIGIERDALGVESVTIYGLIRN